jgi:hypothetical protein
MTYFRQAGYVALSSVLVIAAVILIIGSSVAILSINDLQVSLATKKNEEVLNLVEACVEDALLYLNENNNLPSSVILPSVTCSISLNSQLGDDWIFTTSLSEQTYTKKIQVSVTRTNNITINNWQEVE